MKFSRTEKYFTLDDKPFFLNSAEMHYFRIDKKDWTHHIEKIKEAGCNAVSSYIPWDYHEKAEGEFDFTDLCEWISLCKEAGLFNIVKPGPYILAEYVGAGIPAWFLDKYLSECAVKNSNGFPGQKNVISFIT